MNTDQETLSSELLHILQHSLGVNQYGDGPQYRNHFCTGPGGKDFDACNELVAGGFMKDHGPREISGGMHVFTVTAAGVDAVALQSPPAPPAPKMTRSKMRYQEFLSYDSHMSFR